MTRREARIATMQILYSADLNNISVENVVDERICLFFLNFFLL